MSDLPDKHSELLAETFHGDWSKGPAAEFARIAAAHARARRRTHRTLAVLGTVAALAIASSFVIRRASTPPPADARARDAPVAVAPASRGYEVISDEELLRHLRAQPVLVVKKENGAREIVLLANE